MTPFMANLIIFMILLILTAAVIVIPGLLVKRAIGQVIRIFRSRHSLCAEGGRTIDELGLTPPDFFQRIGRPKDYKPFALHVLVDSGIVRVAEDGTLCLSEEKLRESPFKEQK